LANRRHERRRHDLPRDDEVVAQGALDFGLRTALVVARVLGGGVDDQPRQPQQQHEARIRGAMTVELAELNP
jgi:hypothetical protein